MSQARDDFAKKLNGREYRNEMSSAEESEAKAARLLVVFGASDDLTEFRGILHDEAGAYDGAQHGVLQSEGRWIIFEGDPDSRKPVKTKGTLIKAAWSPKEINASWLIKPAVPHATFDIMEDGDIYCRGAVIDEVDLLPTQRAIATSFSPYGMKFMSIEFSAPLTRNDLRDVHEFLKGWVR